MKKIVGAFCPFVRIQTFFIHNEETDENEEFKISTDNLVEDLGEVANMHNIDSINITGPKKMLDKYKQDFEEKSIANYNKQITFNIF